MSSSETVLNERALACVELLFSFFKIKISSCCRTAARISMHLDQTSSQCTIIVIKTIKYHLGQLELIIYIAATPPTHYLYTTCSQSQIGLANRHEYRNIYINNNMKFLYTTQCMHDLHDLHDLHACMHNLHFPFYIHIVAAPPIVRPVVIERSPLEVIIPGPTYVTTSSPYVGAIQPVIYQPPTLQPSVSFGLSIGTPTTIVQAPAPPSFSVVSSPVRVEVRRSPSPCRKVVTYRQI